MDIATLGGIIGGFVLIVISIALNGVSFALYVSVSSLIMVVGGSYAAMVASAPLSRSLGLMKFLNKAIKVTVYEEARIIRELVGFAESARKEGLLSLDDRLEDVDDDFMKEGMRLVVDGTDPDVIKKVLNTNLNYIQERHQKGIDFFDNWSKLAPAFGMIGTLIGLIAMMANLEDTSAVGAGMALALITTLYGSIFANLVLIPLKLKMEDRNNDEIMVKEIMAEGILSIQSGDNPRILEQKLATFLPPDQRSEVQSEEG